MRNSGTLKGFIEVEVIDSRLTKEKKEKIDIKKRELFERLENEDGGLTREQKSVLGLDEDTTDPNTITEYLMDEDFEEFTYKKYIREDLRVIITDKGEEKVTFLDIDGEVIEVTDSVSDLVKKFAQ
jgi:hypothetical protein